MWTKTRTRYVFFPWICRHFSCRLKFFIAIHSVRSKVSFTFHIWLAYLKVTLLVSFQLNSIGFLFLIFRNRIFVRSSFVNIWHILIKLHSKMVIDECAFYGHCSWISLIRNWTVCISLNWRFEPCAHSQLVSSAKFEWMESFLMPFSCVM